MFATRIIVFTILFLALLFLVIARKWIIKRLFTDAVNTLLSDQYHENLMELLRSSQHLGLLTTIENQLRAEKGSLLYRPIGTTKGWSSLDAVTFTPAQTTPFPPR